jgi:hypothetical protein
MYLLKQSLYTKKVTRLYTLCLKLYFELLQMNQFSVTQPTQQLLTALGSMLDSDPQSDSSSLFPSPQEVLSSSEFRSSLKQSRFTFFTASMILPRVLRNLRWEGLFSSRCFLLFSLFCACVPCLLVLILTQRYITNPILHCISGFVMGTQWSAVWAPPPLH